MKKMKFLAAVNLTALTDKINSHLEQDWEIYGTVVKIDNEFIQAVYMATNIGPNLPGKFKAKKKE
jgi:hypothetical protein